MPEGISTSFKPGKRMRLYDLIRPGGKIIPSKVWGVHSLRDPPGFFLNSRVSLKAGGGPACLLPDDLCPFLRKEAEENPDPPPVGS